MVIRGRSSEHTQSGPLDQLLNRPHPRPHAAILVTSRRSERLLSIISTFFVVGVDMRNY